MRRPRGVGRRVHRDGWHRVSRARAILVAVLTAVTPSLMLIAAIGKVADWDGFQRSLATFTLIPSTVLDVASAVVPAAEAATFVLVVSGRRALANGVCVALLSVFMAVIGWHWMHNVKPTCACLGLWTRYLGNRETLIGLFMRDGALMLFAAISAALCWREYSRRQLDERGVERA